FEQPYVPEVAASKPFAAHKALAREAAAKSLVLLKNDKKTLPFSKDLHSIAVIGEDATEARLGGYSGPGNGSVSILEGIRQRAGKNIAVTYMPGPGRNTRAWTVVPRKYLTHT